MDLNLEKRKRLARLCFERDDYFLQNNNKVDSISTSVLINSNLLDKKYNCLKQCVKLNNKNLEIEEINCLKKCIL